jgi:hypothetical protein
MFYLRYLCLFGSSLPPVVCRGYGHSKCGKATSTSIRSSSTIKRFSSHKSLHVPTKVTLEATIKQHVSTKSNTVKTVYGRRKPNLIFLQ